MARLPVLRRDDLGPEQRTVWEAVTGGERARAHRSSGGLVDGDGGLVGPFNAWLHCPALGRPAADLGAAVRFRGDLDRRLLETAIVAVAAHWRSSFEFWAHRSFAADAGVSEHVLDAIRAGEDVGPAPDDERLVVETCRELLGTGRLATDTYERVVALLGTAGVVELVTVVGYYTLVALNLNAFEVGVPPDVTPAWPP